MGAGNRTPAQVALLAFMAALYPTHIYGSWESGDVYTLSAMTAADHVKAIHVFNEKNPQPDVVSFHLGPRAGRASVATRIRLADTQTVVAIAELSDGSFWSARTSVVVTLAACLEDA